MRKLELRLLSAPQISLNRAPVHFRLRKSLALLVYLAVTDQPHSRDKLATLLWPGYDQSTTRAYLRKALSLLQQDLPGEWLEADRHQIRFCSGSGVWLDVAEFQQLANGNDKNLDALEHAASLYTGDFLDGFSLPDAEGFEEWRRQTAEALRGKAVGVLGEVTDGLTGQGESARALAFARRRVEIDPYDEAAHAALMRLYAANGQNGLAIRQYETLTRLLREELGIDPAPETTAAWREIVESGQRSGGAALSQPKPVVDSPASPPSNLPRLATSFVGREEETAQIVRQLSDPACRLLTLIGPGGMGKSRLAIEAGARLLADSPERFPDGVWFVPLVAAENRDGLVAQLADTFQLPFVRLGDIFSELLARLAAKRLLIVLDNCEQLVEHAPLFSQLLTATAGVKLLVTSRERMNLPEEWVIHLHGLAVPPDPDLSGAPTTFTRMPDFFAGAPDRSSTPALTLFAERLRQLQPDFSPAGEEGRWAGQICRMVGGMPLALELAAAWGDVLSCREIAGQLAQSLGILRSDSPALPERHRSMPAVLASAWQRLSPEEQSVLAACSLFRGGCTREAVAAVTGASLPLLQGLIHRSLVRRTGDRRYEMQELIRQYAAERLAGNTTLLAQAQAAHARYFAGFIQSREAELSTAPSAELLDAVAADVENVRAAWRYAFRTDDVELLAQLMQGFINFRHHQGEWAGVVDGAYLEAAHHCEARWGRLLPTRQGEAAARMSWVWGVILHEAARGQRRAAQTAQYIKLNLRALEQLRPVAERWPDALAQAYLERSLCSEVGNEPFKPHGVLDEGIGWAKRAKTPYTLSALLNEKGGRFIREGRFAEALVCCEEAAILAAQTNFRTTEVIAVMRCGELALRMGDYEKASAFLQRAYGLKAGSNNAFVEWSVAVARMELFRALGQFSKMERETDYLEGYLRRTNTGVAPYCRIKLPIEQAILQRDIGNLQIGEQILEEGMDDFISVGFGGVIEAEARFVLARIAQEKGEFLKAIEEARRSLAIHAARQNGPQQAEALALLSQLHAEAQSETPESIRQSIGLALRLSQAAGTVPVTLEALYSLALLLANTHAADEAIPLLALIDKHPATRWETRQRANALSMRLRGGMALARFASLREKGFELALEQVVEREVGQYEQRMEIPVEA